MTDYTNNSAPKKLCLPLDYEYTMENLKFSGRLCKKVRYMEMLNNSVCTVCKAVVIYKDKNIEGTKIFQV